VKEDLSGGVYVKENTTSPKGLERSPNIGGEVG